MSIKTQLGKYRKSAIILILGTGILVNFISCKHDNLKAPESIVNATPSLKVDSGVSQEIHIWPRGKTVYLPTGLEQFVFIEFPCVEKANNVQIKLTLPNGMKIKSYPTASSWAVLPSNHIVPKKTSQQCNFVELTVSAEDAKEKLSKPFWIVFSMDVKTPPGDYSLNVEMIDDGKVLHSKNFNTKIYPELKNIKFEKLQAISWHYNGLDKNFIPTYVDMLRASGINAIGAMRGEGSSNEWSISDYALSKNTKLIFVFFIHDAIKHAQKSNVLSGENTSYDLTWLLDHPVAFKQILQKYIDAMTNGKKYSAILHDAESHAYMKGEIYGDFSPYGIENFRKFAEIDAKTNLNQQIIKEKFLNKWVWFRCKQSNEITKILRDLIDETWPERQLHVYSGYEFDKVPFKDRTREYYGVDWKSMSDTGMDFGGAGYGGGIETIRATRDALKGKAVFIPAEMRIVNFGSKLHINKSPEEWSMRLIEVFLNSGMKGGLSIWYGNVLEGGALIAMNRAFDFMQKIESFALTSECADDAIKVYPDTEKENVYVLRKGGNTLIIAVNNEATAKQLRIRLVGFTLKGYNSDLEIKDMVSGEQIPAEEVLKVEIPAYSYRLLNILEDGN